MRHLDVSKPVHASCVAVDGKALLILGKSGSGKSALGLSLIAMGAKLVADDRVILTRHEGAILASCPNAICGLIEARGVGLLHAAHVQDVPVTLAVDMDVPEVERLPQKHQISIFDRTLPLLRRVDGLHFGSALFQLLRCGRSEP
jgi:HPr kinase/phosphorylase